MEENNVILFYLKSIPGYLSTPLGLLAIIGVLLYGGYCLFGRLGNPLAVLVLLVVGIMGKDENSTTQTVLIPALQMLRAFNRVIFALTLILLVIRQLTTEKTSWRRETIPRSVVALCILQILFGLGWIIGQGDLARGAGSIGLSLLLTAGLAGMVGRGCQSLRDVRNLFRAAELAGLAFCVLSMAQLMVNAKAAYFQGRFAGISDNPQYAAIFTAILVNISVYMAGTPTEAKLLRIGHFLCAIVFAVFMMWTGSRTGFVLLVVGLVVQLHARPWLLLFSLGGGLVAMYLLTSANEYAAAPMSRLVTTEDSGRFRIFAQAFGYFLRYPIFGRSTMVMENCFLAVASCTGIVGLTFLFVCGISHFQNVVFIWRNRRWLGPERRIVDLLGAWSVAMLGASMFEGFVLAIATAAIVFVILLLSITAMMKEYIERVAEQTQMEGYPTEVEAVPALV